jgi:hypothetical protein
MTECARGKGRRTGKLRQQRQAEGYACGGSKLIAGTVFAAENHRNMAVMA